MEHLSKVLLFHLDIHTHSLSLPSGKWQGQFSAQPEPGSMNSALERNGSKTKILEVSGEIFGAVLSGGDKNMME